jgi:hypothetical protein
MTGTAVDAPPSVATPVTTAEARDADRRGDAGSWLRRPLVACVLLFLMYAALSFALNDPRGTLGTDTGGKLATLHMMERNGGLDPDVGYWAERFDPRGELLPLHYTSRIGDKWVNVTTLPMLDAAYPLYLIGGARAVLALPMLAAVLCALAARALARGLGAGDGWSTFWVVGLATPVAIYALDFWEHTAGLALMLWGTVLFVDVARRRAGWRAALAAGSLFGVAATMRTEAVLYLGVTTAVVCLVLAVRDRAVPRAFAVGASSTAGGFAALAANALIERVTLGADLRGTRAAGTVATAATSLDTRVREAFTTTFGLGFEGMRPTTGWVVGAVVVALVGTGAWMLGSPDRRRVALGAVLLAVAVTVYAARLLQDVGFVPGLLTASPFAAVGIVVGWRQAALRLPAAIACVALPLIWATQYSGGADPQWGGRYALLSGALLAVVACVALQGRVRAFAAVAAAAGLVTMGGLVWLSVRSHTVADGMATIVARHDQVLISRQPHFLREGGAFYSSNRHWLSALSDEQLSKAVAVADKSGATEFALVGDEHQIAPARLGGYVRGGTQLVSFIRPDVKVSVVTYRRSQ